MAKHSSEKASGNRKKSAPSETPGETPKNGRRHFIRDSSLIIAGGAIGTAAAASNAVHSGGDDRVRIAFVGCGRRARQLAEAVLNVPDTSVNVVGLSDAFADQTQAMYRSLKGRFHKQIEQACVRASGMNAYEAVLESDADLVYLTTPPFCRPQHFQAAVESGKHVFLEKPLAADIPGLASLNSTAQLAKQSGLAVHVGFQRRHDPRYQETISKIHEGAIGQPLFARAFCNAGPLRSLTNTSKKRRETELEYQIRNWNHFQWTGGDFLLEQHVAGLDVVRWAIERTPLVAQGQGGWGACELGAIAGKPSWDSFSGKSSHENPKANRTQSVSRPQCDEPRDRQSEEVFDHHSVEYEFAGGVHLMSQCRRVAKAWNETNEYIHGTTGRADLAKAAIYDHSGNLVWQSKLKRAPDAGTLAQASAVLDSIRNDKKTNVVAAGNAATASAVEANGAPDGEFDSAVQSTLLAMLGHQASLTGKRIRWSSCLDKLAQNVT